MAQSQKRSIIDRLIAAREELDKVLLLTMLAEIVPIAARNERCFMRDDLARIIVTLAETP
jgi:hypothetical protein